MTPFPVGFNLCTSWSSVWSNSIIAERNPIDTASSVRADTSHQVVKAGCDIGPTPTSAHKFILGDKASDIPAGSMHTW